VRSRLSLDREHLRRLHRKLVCVDDAVAFVGGINLLGDYFDPNHGELEFPRLDYAVRLTGPLVPEVSRALARLWRQVTGQAALPSQVASTELQQSSSGPPQHPPPHPPPHPSDPPPPHAPPPHLTPAMSRQASRGLRAGLLLRDNLIHRRSIERAYLKAIGGAKHEVLIANAYFFPGRRFRRAMIEARRRGVPVRLLLQGRMEYTLPHLATQSLYPPLLDAGIEIIESPPGTAPGRVERSRNMTRTEPVSASAPSPIYSKRNNSVPPTTSPRPDNRFTSAPIQTSSPGRRDSDRKIEFESRELRG
jgi:cardiolipin synthase